MIIKASIQVGNPLIRARARRVSNSRTKAVRKVVRDLTDSMRFHELVGMAAPQIGKSLRIFITEIRETKLRKGDSLKNIDGLRIFINPRIKSFSRKETRGWEGCGSVASSNLFGIVKRSASLVIEAQDKNGKNFKLKADRLLARVIQHEMDHLNGKVFSDKADPSTYMSQNEYLKLRAKKK